MNNLQLIGNIGNDAQVKNVNGNEFVTFTMAVSKKYKKKDGTPVEQTDWFNVVSNRVALAQYLKKGTLIFCEGEISFSTYQDKENNNRVSMDVRERRIQLLSSPKN